MSKDAWYGTTLDGIYKSKETRVPGFQVFIYNPNRTSINEVVLGESKSPKYDITYWVQSIEFKENIIFENNEDSVAGNCVIELNYDPHGLPIEITERTLLDGTPIQIYQGDQRIDESDWIPIFTGTISGNPSIREEGRAPRAIRELTILCVDRAASFLNNVITGTYYEKGDDIGKAVVETAIKFAGLDRREIGIGAQGYEIAHINAQLVDIGIMPGIAQVLFCVGKKPKFDSEGFLIAANTDFEKAPARIYKNKELIIYVEREQKREGPNNSVRLLGLDSNITEVLEEDKRIAHGTITSGFFEDEVHLKIWFSEDTKETGARRAKETYEKHELTRLGEIMGEDIGYTPIPDEHDSTIEWGGVITFDTGYDATLRIILSTTWLVLRTIEFVFNLTYVLLALAAVVAKAADLILFATLMTMTELGRVEWEIWGKPVQFVHQQLCATAQLEGILTEHLKEIELRNDWLYEIEYMRTRVFDLLRRELVKGWVYNIEMIDDPLLDVDDIIQIDDRKYYITSIKKTIARDPGMEGTMQITAWRIQ